MRSTRPPQPAWLSRTASGIEVDLVAGEDGVSPGQACVFYDAAEGQARVLGGGFIQSAVAAPRAHATARASRRGVDAGRRCWGITHALSAKRKSGGDAEFAASGDEL